VPARSYQLFGGILRSPEGRSAGAGARESCPSRLRARGRIDSAETTHCGPNPRWRRSHPIAIALPNVAIRIQRHRFDPSRKVLRRRLSEGAPAGERGRGLAQETRVGRVGVLLRSFLWPCPPHGAGFRTGLADGRPVRDERLRSALWSALRGLSGARVVLALAHRERPRAMRAARNRDAPRPRVRGRVVASVVALFAYGSQSCRDGEHR
jgi:hypothetical protein